MLDSVLAQHMRTICPEQVKMINISIFLSLLRVWRPRFSLLGVHKVLNFFVNCSHQWARFWTPFCSGDVYS